LSIEVEFPQRQSQPELEVQESPFQLLIQVSAQVGAQAKAAEEKRAAATIVDFILRVICVDLMLERRFTAGKELREV
jgi:hypothetical protein